MATQWVSRISGPIASHTALDIGPSSHRSYQSGVPHFEVQGRGFESNRAYKTPNKDYLRDNVRRMREIQKASKLRDEEKAKPIKSTWRSSRYDAVPSKVAEHIYREPPPPRRPASAGFSRPSERDREGRAVPALEIDSRRSGDAGQEREERVGACRAGSARQAPLRRTGEVDFIRANREAARSARFRRSPSLDQLDELRQRKESDQAHYDVHQKGRVPNYLIHQREEDQRARQEWEARQPDHDQPPGHRRMSESERHETLSLLKTSEKDLLVDLCKLPIRTDTLRVRRRKEEIEAKLAEVEEAIKIFSKPKVFVRID